MYRKISNNNTRIYEIYLRASFQNDRDIYFHSPRFQVAFHRNLSRSFVTVPLSIHHITRHCIFDNIIIDRAQFLMDSKKNSPTNPLLVSPLCKTCATNNRTRTLAKSTSRIYRDGIRDRLKKRWDAGRRCWRFKRSRPRLECPARETSGQ